MADDSYDTPEKKTNDILETNDIVDKIDHKPPQITSLKTPNDNESDRSKGSVGPSPVKSFLSTPSVNTSQTLLTRETTARKLDRYLTAKDAAKAMSIAFVNVCAHVPIAPNSKETKQILFDVSGTINSGELVALMGPSGAGKSTLLNVLGLRFEEEYSGQVYINGEARTKDSKRRIGYVLQNDTLLPNVTVHETLEFTAKMRLPREMNINEKLQRVEDIIYLMGLKSCENTMVQNLSGGEKKRTSIANEMIVNPSVLFLDEPTSGLDSTSAYSILTTLKELTKHGRTVIASVHQPNSQMFTKFDKLLLLASGKLVYFDKISDATNYFGECGYPCPMHYNPADFILELVTDNFEKEEETSNTIVNGNVNEIDLADVINDSKNEIEIENENKTDAIEINGNDNESDNESKLKTLSLANKEEIKKHLIECWSKKQAIIDEEMNQKYKNDTNNINNIKDSNNNNDTIHEKWPTNWLEQFYLLLYRAMKHRRGHNLQASKFIELTAVAVITGLIWFQMKKTETNINDWVAALFFINVYIQFMTMYRGVVHFPVERSVIKRERQSGTYRLSAYYISKLTAEIPVDIILPMWAVTIVYWMVRVNDSFGYFLLFVLAMILGVAAANAFGTFIGCCVSNFEDALTALAVLGLLMMLTGSFYVPEDEIPDWISWIRYISFMRYVYLITLGIVMNDIEFDCADPSQFEVCENTNVNVIVKNDLLDYLAIDEPLYQSLLFLFITLIVWHLLAYYFLRKNTAIH